MDLERITVALRPRGAWESLDLGYQLVRRYSVSILAAWLAVYVPIAVAVYAIVGEQPFIAFAVCWWLRPVFERAVLSVLGPAVFGAAPSAREILLGWPSFVARVFAPSPSAAMQLVAGLTWRRLTPWRSYVLPVDHLEMLGLGARRARVSVLGRNHRDTAVGLGFLSLMLEATLYFALLAFVALLVPQALSYNPVAWVMEGGSFAARTAQAVLLGVAYSLAGPLYVGAGFALYLNRRMELEAWDLELAFRRMTQRRSAPAAVLAVLCLLPTSSFASTEPQEAIRQVLNGPEFSDYEEEYEWRFVRDEPEYEEEATDRSPGFLQFLGQALAKLLFWLGVIVATVVLVIVGRALWRMREPSRRSDRGAVSTPATLFGKPLWVSPSRSV
ncbi:MAG: hypothetical protein AAFX94_12845 [Myxococcota bacterium]